MVKDKELIRIWREQKKYPVVLRKAGPPLLVKLPQADDNLWWLKDAHVRWPTWNGGGHRWEVPMAWFDDVVRRAAARWGAVYVIQLVREHQVCAPACWNAEGVHCECSCLGENHGSGQPEGRWYEISETLAFNWEDRQYACRLIKAAGQPVIPPDPEQNSLFT